MVEKKMVPVLIVMIIMILISIWFMVQGLMMEMQVPVEEKAFNDLQAQYWTIDKATRDAAPTGSELNQQLVQIQQYPSQLLTLKLVGIAFILSGIFILLLGILIALMMMPGRLGKEIKKLKM